MAFGKLKVKAKAKSGRGSVDASAVIDAVKETWEPLQNALKEMEEADQKALREHFNNLIDGETDLGEILFGTAEDFESRLKFLDDEVQKEYTDELIKTEVIDGSELEPN